MSQVRFISDLHFKHKNLAIDLRKFPDVYTHDQYIIDCWNSVVHKKDLTYILGDVTMESDNYNILDQLNGRKIVIGGNHDLVKHSKKLLNYVDGIAGIVKYSSKLHGTWWLTHYPIHHIELDMSLNGKIKGNIHGHIHAAYDIPDIRYINVSAEVMNYTPKLLKELLPKIN